MAFEGEMDQIRKRLFESDWYSPRRLRDTLTADYDFPGDRFIPNRSLMNLDQAQSLLTNRTKEAGDSIFGESYRQRLKESLTLDLEGRPFRMLVFRGSPKSSRKFVHHIDDMRRRDAEELNNRTEQCQPRQLPKREARILDAPNISNDFYASVIDWGKNNVLAVALGTTLYLWNSKNHAIQKLLQVEDDNESPRSVAWSADGRSLAIGYMNSTLEIWDAETSKCIRNLEGHKSRVAAIAWNEHTVTSGSRDKSIISHDARMQNSLTSHIQAHTGEVCGLKWSSLGNVLASGGDESIIYIWDASKMNSSSFLHRFKEHSSAVKALAWCPYQFNVLASGGGTKDGCIRLWNTQNGKCIDCVDTKSQICGLEWNRHHKEILSGHGYGMPGTGNNLSLWKYPSLKRVWQIDNHHSRVLNLSQSPDGLMVVSAGGDETLRFWDIFGPLSTKQPRVSDLDSLLSLKTSPIR